MKKYIILAIVIYSAALNGMNVYIIDRNLIECNNLNKGVYLFQIEVEQKK
jgi:hypothetical protein